MYWKIDQRLPVDGSQGNSLWPNARVRAHQSEAAFADMLASQISGRLPDTPDAANPLSAEIIEWMTKALNPSVDNAPTTTMDWLSAVATLPMYKARPPAEPLAPQPTVAASSTKVPAHIASLIDRAASRYRLDPSLITSVIAQESSFDPQAVSPAGAQGLMQLMPETAHALKVADPFDPAQNIDGGSRYLAGLIKRYHGDVRMALAAYNWGMGNLEQQPAKLPAETRHYVASIMQRWQADSSARA